MRNWARALAVSAALLMPGAHASEAPEPPDQSWSFEGPLGGHDATAARRGFKVYAEACWSCHALDHIRFRDLGGLGFADDEVKSLAAGYEVPAGPNEYGDIVDDQGLLFMRRARPEDPFALPYLNEAAARTANDGVFPTELSLIVKARRGGPDYLFAFLTGYTEPPPALDLAEGRFFNAYFPGQAIAMEPSLSDGLIAYDDGTPETVDQYARDIVAFLAWTADPHLNARNRLGLGVVAFLAVFFVLLLALKRRIWARLD